MKDEKEKRITDSEDAMDVDQLMEEYDLDTSRLRKLKGTIGTIAMIIAIAMSTFQFLTAGFGTLISARQRSLHIMFAFTLGFLFYPSSQKRKKNKVEILDFVLIGLVLLVFGYLFVYYKEIAVIYSVSDI